MKNKFLLLSFCVFICIIIASCYKNNEEELYKDFLASCDTTAISYSKSIQPLFAFYCDNCHNTENAAVLGAGINLDGPARIVAFETVFPNILLGSLLHVSPYSPMPKGGRKLDNCNLSKIEAWINAGFPDN